MDPITVYTFIAIISALLLFVTLIFGDFIDVDMDIDIDVDADVDVGFGDFGGAGISPLSLPVLLIFSTSFGSFGGIFEGLHINSVLVPFIAGMCSFGLTGGAYLVLLKVFISTQANTTVKKGDLLGKTAQVTVPINPGKPGQVMVVTTARGRTLRDALASEKISSHTEVKIIGFSGNAVRVERVNE